jgi:multicomponent Na+:H+ antiporter subunit B
MTDHTERGMTIIVKTVTRLTIGFILLYGIYIALSGHVAPGGGFAGGVIVALSFVHIMLAFGKDVALKRLRSGVLRVAINAAALIFLYTVVVNFFGGGSFAHPIIKKIAGRLVFESEYIMPLCEMTMIGCGLFAIFVALVLASKADKNAE